MIVRRKHKLDQRENFQKREIMFVCQARHKKTTQHIQRICSFSFNFWTFSSLSFRHFYFAFFFLVDLLHFKMLKLCTHKPTVFSFTAISVMSLGSNEMKYENVHWQSTLAGFKLQKWMDWNVKHRKHMEVLWSNWNHISYVWLTRAHIHEIGIKMNENTQNWDFIAFQMWFLSKHLMRFQCDLFHWIASCLFSVPFSFFKFHLPEKCISVFVCTVFRLPLARRVAKVAGNFFSLYFSLVLFSSSLVSFLFLSHSLVSSCGVSNKEWMFAVVWDFSIVLRCF